MGGEFSWYAKMTLGESSGMGNVRDSIRTAPLDCIRIV